MRLLLAPLISALLLAACGGGGASDDEDAAVVRVDRDTVEVVADVGGTTPDSEVVELSTTSAPSGGFSVGLEYTRNGIDSISYDPHGNTAVVQIQWQDPASLPLGTYEDTITIHVCYDEACEQHADGSPIVVTTRYGIQQEETTAAGNTALVRALNLVASDLAWNPISNRLYAAVPGEGVIAVIDPQSARIVRRQAIDGEPRRIAVSDDGRYLYVSTSPTLVRRLRLPNFDDDDTYHLTSEFSVLDLDVAPGTTTLAVSTQADGPDYIQIFGDDGFETRYGATTGNPGFLTWNADGVTVYSKSRGTRTDLHAADVVLPADNPGSLTTTPEVFARPGGDLSFANGNLVDDFGTVVDADTGDLHGTLALSSDTIGRTVADGPLDRLYAAGTTTPPRRIGVFDGTSLERLDTLEMPNVPNHGVVEQVPVTDLVRWGNEGLAIAGNGRILLVSGTFVAP